MCLPIYMYIYVYIYIYIYIYVYTYKYKYVHVCLCAYDTGWRRFIGCFKLQVIFRKRATNYRALLRKMNYEDNLMNLRQPVP